MFRKSAKTFIKRCLSLSNVKILYSRITHTRFTTAYFFLALFACLALTILQTLTFVENSAAVSILEEVHNLPDTGIVMLEHRQLILCTELPTLSREDCRTVVTFASKKPANVSMVSKKVSVKDMSQKCILSLKWLDDILRDAKREDLASLAFNLWLFILAITTVLNESIPHLVAGLFGHVLGTAWAAYRVYATDNFMRTYENQIVPQACGGVDLLNGWWAERMLFAIPNLVFNVVTLIGYAYLTFHLFKAYATETFSRVGASPQIHRMYKAMLVFLVCLQLSGFFSLASSALWLDKICHKPIVEFVVHHELYLAAFIVILVMTLPWLFLGWVCVRKECKIRFGIFIAVAILFLAISTTMFFSSIYRYIFVTWPFFTTVTVTAYLLVLTTTLLSMVCRLNFGKGLAHYFVVTEALDGLDFTPVLFSKGSDIEKHLSFGDRKTSYLDLIPLNLEKTGSRKSKAFSFGNSSPIQLFAAKPLMSEMGDAPERLTGRNRLTKAPPERSTSFSRRSNSIRRTPSPEIIVTDFTVPELPKPVVVSFHSDDATLEAPPGIEQKMPPGLSPVKAGVTKMARGKGLPSNPRLG